MITTQFLYTTEVISIPDMNISCVVVKESHKNRRLKFTVVIKKANEKCWIG